MDEREVTYVMKTCNCLLNEEGLEYRYLGSRGKCRVCKDHGTSIDHREVDCTVCGASFEQSKSSKLSMFCPGCRHENHLQNVRNGKIEKQLALYNL